MIITISGSYGAGGSELGPRVAQRLGLAFVDRAVPVSVADDLGVSLEDAEEMEHNSQSRLWEFLARMSPASGLAVPLSLAYPNTGRELSDAMETALRAAADGGGAVILGHAAAVVLADRTDALHVRLDGAPEGRVQAAMRQHGIDAETAEAKRKDNDKIRSGYVKHFYRLDSSSPSLYHLVLDTVRLGWDRAERVILEAANDLPST